MSRYEKGDEPVPGYWLEQFLGQGGFGQVWKAIAPGGTETALKIISLSGKQGLKEFRALKLVKRLRHPNLVPIFAYWLKDDAGNLLDDSIASDVELEPRETMVLPASGTIRPNLRETAPRPTELIMAMGLGEKDLSRRLEECKDQGLQGIPVEELLGYMEDSARAIDYLNSPKQALGGESIAVQHCDIKPFNIMIVGGAAQVCDFGLARMLGDVRKTATAAGTVAYVAPECLSTCEPSNATDQYSLAITYVELRIGRLPYKSEVFTDVVNAVLKGTLELTGLPVNEQIVVRQATALDPLARFPTASAMIHALRRAVENPLQEALPPPAPRRSFVPALILVLLLAGVSAGGWYAWPQIEAWLNRDQQTVLNDTKTKQQQKKTSNDDDRNRSSQDSQKSDSQNKDDIDKPPSNGNMSAVTTVVDENKEAERQRAQKIKVVEARVAKASTLIEQQRFDDGIAELEPAIKEAPELTEFARELVADVYLLRGTCFLRQGDFSRAIDDLSQSILLDPRDFKPFSRRANAYFQQKQYDKAIADLTDALKIDPAGWDYLSRAEAYRALGRFTPAIEDLNHAIKLSDDPQLRAACYGTLGQIYSAEHRWPQAVDNYEAALKQDSNDLDIAGRLAMLRAMAPDKAVRNGKQALELAQRCCEATRQSDPVLLDILASAHAETGNFEEAIRIEKKAIALQSKPKELDAYRLRLASYNAGKPYYLPE